MNELFEQTGAVLRELGFRGSGQNYRKTDGDFGAELRTLLARIPVLAPGRLRPPS